MTAQTDTVHEAAPAEFAPAPDAAAATPEGMPADASHDAAPDAVPTASRPRRRYGLGALIATAVLSATATATAVLVVAPWHAAGGGEPREVAAATLYQCPMHPSIVQDHPGECPICGMKLVAAPRGAARPAGEPARKIAFYRSPMDPRQTSPTPRQDEMGMDYVAVYEDEVAGAPAVAGLATVDIEPARQQLIGLKTSEVVWGDVGGAWRTVGRVAIDETRVRHVNLKVAGFVERIYVDFIGKKVRRGDPLFSIYSPELLATQEEFLLALKTREALGRAPGALAAAPGDDGEALVGAVRRKLALWDVPAEEVERLARTGEPSKTLTLYSPVAGVVTRKDVVEGMKLDAGAMPYEIVDLSSLWVLADVYESELRLVREGMPATLKLNAFPNREFTGKVVFIDPLLNPQTRTVKVRLTFANPAGELRPEMFGEVVLRGAPHQGLRVPPDAIIDSGIDKVVFVAVGEGKFAPRKVRLGETDATAVEVITGLQQGERVVTRANFLIDSESRLRASLAELAGAAAAEPQRARVLPGATQPGEPAAPPAAPPAVPPPAHAGHEHAP
jgi:Cu(I)/Ag(I) efflux system membrane fusion protein